jgi:hypothetical protein
VVVSLSQHGRLGWSVSSWGSGDSAVFDYIAYDPRETVALLALVFDFSRDLDCAGWRWNPCQR